VERFFGIFWVIVPLVVATVIAWRQVRAWDWQRAQPDLSADDRRYFRRQVLRRLALCLLLILAAALLGGLYGMGILDELQRLNDVGETAQAEGRKLTAEEQAFVSFAFKYVGCILIVVLLILIVGCIELAAIRRYGMRHRRRIREDRQAMLRRQLPELYRERRERRERGEDPDLAGG
jgi:hypothetical protein